MHTAVRPNSTEQSCKILNAVSMRVRFLGEERHDSKTGLLAGMKTAAGIFTSGRETRETAARTKLPLGHVASSTQHSSYLPYVDDRQSRVCPSVHATRSPAASCLLPSELLTVVGCSPTLDSSLSISPYSSPYPVCLPSVVAPIPNPPLRAVCCVPH